MREDKVQLYVLINNIMKIEPNTKSILNLKKKDFILKKYKYETSSLDTYLGTRSLLFSLCI